MDKANMNSSQRPTNSNQSVYTSSTKSTKVKKRGCGCGKKKKRS